MSEIVLVPGPLNQFVFTEPEVKLAPREKSRSGKSPIEEPAPRRGRRAPKPEPPPVIAGPDTGWPPPQVMTTIVINRDALKNSKSYKSWADLLKAVETDSADHLAADGQLYARVTTAEAFNLNRAKKVLGELGGKRLVVEYRDVARKRTGKRAHGRQQQIPE